MIASMEFGMKVVLSEEDFDGILDVLTLWDKNGIDAERMLLALQKLDATTQRLVDMYSALSDEPTQEYVVTAQPVERV